MDDPEAADWLTQFGGGPDDFEWDAGNRTKNRKHEVAQSAVEALFHHPLVFVGLSVDAMQGKVIYEEALYENEETDRYGRSD